MGMGRAWDRPGIGLGWAGDRRFHPVDGVDDSRSYATIQISKLVGQNYNKLHGPMEDQHLTYMLAIFVLC